MLFFNKDELFNGDIQDLKDDLRHLTTEEIAELVSKASF